MSLLLVLSKFDENTMRAMSAKFGKVLRTPEDILHKLPPDFPKKYGKIGYKITLSNGNIKEYIHDKKYLSDKKYRNQVNKNNVTPSFQRKVNKLGHTDLSKEVESVKRKVGLKDYDSTQTKGTLRKLARVASMVGIAYPLMRKALIKGEGEKKSPKMLAASIDEGIRQGVLKDKILMFKGSGKMCMMTTTSADVPDETHMHMEYVPILCEDLLSGDIYLNRFGCQHDYVEL